MKYLVRIFLVIFVAQVTNAQNSNNLSPFFDQTDQFLKTYVSNDLVQYQKLKNEQKSLVDLVMLIEEANLEGADAQTLQAFYINAYNILVIEEVVQQFPIKSVQDVGGFFDSKKKRVAGKKMTLNQLEKSYLLDAYGDPRFHFVLVCAAVDCPPIAGFAYRPESLEQQLEKQTRSILNDPGFIKVNESEETVAISQIFQWYSADFGGNKKEALAYINGYREQPVPASYSIEFYSYDWKLNGILFAATDGTSELANNAGRYVVSAAIPRGNTETKIFNNLYTQRFGSNGERTDRSTFFTTIFSFLYGVNNRFNAGVDIRYRRVLNDQLPSSVLTVFEKQESSVSRAGITTIGPKIRWAPVRAWQNFSVQSALWLPIGDDLEGNGERPFIDWNGATWWTQFFNDFSLGNNFSLFTEIDFMWEDIGNGNNGATNRISTPATVIVSYFPNPKTTVYALTNFSPFWQRDFDYFGQAGLGAKYQFTPNIELELLYTAFTNQFLQEVGGDATTFNIGLRFTTR